MKQSYLILTTLFSFIICSSYGQTVRIDIVKYYDFRSISIDYVKNKYLINGRKVSRPRGEEIDSCNCILEGRCGDTTKHFFYVKTYDLKERLIHSAFQEGPEGIFWGPYKEYYKNGNLKCEGQYLFLGLDWRKYRNEKNLNKKIGTWKYYDRKGKLKRTEKFDN